MTFRPKVLISVGKVNFPPDVADALADVADVQFVTGDYGAQRIDTQAVVVGGEQVNEGYLAQAPQLKIVARFGVGYDAVDVAACTRRRVYVGHTPDILSAAVADLAWALILAWMRRIAEGDRFVRTEWGKRQSAFPFGWDLSGKTVGFLGVGRIGAEAAKRGFGFGVTMIYHDVIRRPDLEQSYRLEAVSFPELLHRSERPVGARPAPALHRQAARA